MGEHRSTTNPASKEILDLDSTMLAQMGIVLDSEFLLTKNLRAQAV